MQRERLTSRLSELQAKLSDQLNSTATLHEEYERAKHELKYFQEQVNVLSDQLYEKEREISSLKEELDSSQQSPNKEQLKESRELGEKSATTKETVSCSIPSAGMANKEELQCGSELDSLRTEAVGLKDLKVLQETRIQSLENEKDVFQRENVKLNRQLANLKGHLIEVSMRCCILVTRKWGTDKNLGLVVKDVV